MPARSSTPGLIVIKRKNGSALYWSARSLARDIEGFPDKLIRIATSATPDQIIDICEKQTERFESWLYGDRSATYRTDTIASLCDAFERHPHSPMQEVKANTADSYMDSIKVLRNTIAQHQVRHVAPVMVKEWFSLWSEPGKAGTPRIKRAHDAVSALRMVLGFGFVLGDDACGKLRDQLAMIRFKRGGRRDSSMTYQHALAFIEKAKELGKPMMALGLAAQFETMLRQKDVIGEHGRDGIWRGAFAWENCTGWRLTVKTSKTKAPITFDLTQMQLLWPLLRDVPQGERHGAVIKGLNGEPIRERTYRKWYRQVADAAGIPKDVWNMDSRAGAVTEALEAGAPMAQVARAATHSKEVMTQRYDRDVTQSVVEIAEARQARRAK